MGAGSFLIVTGIPERERTMNTGIALLATLALAACANAQIVNGDFQAGNTGFSSGFTYSTSGGSPGLYDEGTYGVVSYDTLHPSWGDFFDHTFGDATGLYEVVNGATNNTSAGPSWGELVTLAPFTQYTLSAWFASVYGGAPSAVEFRVDGVLVTPSVQLGPVIGAWEQHSVTFTTGASASVLLQIWDTSGVQSGNDYAIDDITLTPTPGSAALLGIGVLASARRRRA
jgi:hypothetical protein